MRRDAFSGRGDFPDQRGFDHFYGLLGGAVDYCEHINHQTGTLDWWRGGAPAKDEDYPADLFADEAMKRIKSRDGSKPLLLHLAFNAAHGPMNLPSGKSASRGAAMYAAVVESMDAAIGRVMTVLADEQLADSSVVLFFCDNGAQGGAHGGGVRSPRAGLKAGIHTAESARAPSITLCVTGWTFN